MATKTTKTTVIPEFKPVSNAADVQYRSFERQPVLFEALKPIVEEAIANGGESPSWYSGNGNTMSSIRNAIKRHGYKTNFGTLNDELVFKVNGVFIPRGPREKKS